MLQKILVAGAGKSSHSLIQYLLQNAAAENWHVTVADNSLEAVIQKTGKHPASAALQLDINNEPARQAAVKDADIVVSLMPPALHVLLAEDCLKFNKHLITSSYISPQMAAMDEAARQAGLMFMCEMGLDPGIDHMTASQILDEIKAKNGSLLSFKSYCGGLVAPESDTNPWRYKFTWNPRNIITAGADGAQYLEHGKEKRVGYQDMFIAREPVNVEGLGHLAYYPNRDSLHYIKLYNVPEVQDFMRATLRYPEFCRGWEVMIKLGLTDVNIRKDVSGMTNKAWLAATMECSAADVDKKVKIVTGDDKEVVELLYWLGLFDDTLLPIAHGTNGDILLSILLPKWEMLPDDKDMVVMQHEVIYLIENTKHLIKSTLIVTGDDSEETAMAKTVGLPMAILCQGILDGSIQPVPGVNIPMMPEIYKPVLQRLEGLGIVFKDVKAIIGQ